ncbi:MAG: hypothetical protein ACR2NP_21030, partial [Pirellulaceae bacterium]
MIRLATNQDCQGVIDLISVVYAEYEDRVCLDGAEADLLDLQANYDDRGGCFWVLDFESKIKG